MHSHLQRSKFSMYLLSFLTSVTAVQFVGMKPVKAEIVTFDEWKVECRNLGGTPIPTRDAQNIYCKNSNNQNLSPKGITTWNVRDYGLRVNIPEPSSIFAILTFGASAVAVLKHKRKIYKSMDE